MLELLEHGLRLAKQGPEETVECGEAVWEALERRKELLELIRRSIRERRFRVWYQPVYRCGTGAFSSAEALLRLEDFQGRAVPPSVFIPLDGVGSALQLVGLDAAARLGGPTAAGTRIEDGLHALEAVRAEARRLQGQFPATEGTAGC